MVKVFVSGCYDILHAGHVQFFREARALGDYLIVSFASADVLWLHKRRRSSLPDEHKQALIASLDMVDEVVVGKGCDEGIDFYDHFRRLRPDILAVTEDDKYTPLKQALCAEVGARYVALPKTPPQFTPISTTEIVRRVRAPSEAPLRVDFAGGWLDVPRHARDGGYIVNCAISPTVSLTEWPYERNAGLGGSGAWALLNGLDGTASELALGVGWQDPAVIREGGLCVWRSGAKPLLELKTDGALVHGRLALWWSGQPHNTPGEADRRRDYDAIYAAGRRAREAVWHQDFDGLAEAVRLSAAQQEAEGMRPLPKIPGAVAAKYCGGGHGGYAVYLFAEAAARDAAVAVHGLRAVEPYLA
ncbi:MAG TPA: adenylyltransferase/cytidyltransferase family protein [Candidatus Synoicihabitans sp.]|nr:adenylyltransferase/cytidyltransferase family protein [Candidatus Synoicihabitans sp.]